MKRIFTLLLSLFIATLGMAQAPSGVFKKASVAPVIDGVVDAVWSEANVYNIDRVVETAAIPTLGEPGETTWRGLWSEEGVFVLLNVTDDAFYPAYVIPSDATWEYDKPELYFDCNYDLKDGVGPVNNGPGHHQFAPPFVKGKIDGTPINDNGITYADVVDGSNYIAEYFIPYDKLIDREGSIVDLTNPVGFDVTIIDRDPDDPGRRNALWANNTASSSWDNMDEAGTITFEGAEAPIDITSIAITGGTEITTDNGTLQLNATFTPEDATQPYKWVLTNGTGMATISSKGLVSAQRNGTVSVKAFSSDEFVASNEITITISNQVVTKDEINLFKNGNFELGAENTENWLFTTNAAAGGPSVVDGWLKFDMVPIVNRWDLKINQPVKIADNSTKYIIKFKAYASSEMSVPLIGEDAANSYPKDGVSTSPYGATSDWAIPVTTIPTWFEVDVVFANLKENSKYEINWQIGLLDGTFYLDSVFMYAESDLALLSTSSKTMAFNPLNVYPNPVGKAHTLIISMNALKGKVAIYNALGQKIMEKMSIGNIATFNVSSLRKGMYFVRLEDGTTSKFIK